MLNEFLKQNGFSEVSGITGVYNNGINVYTAWDGERKVVNVNGTQVLVSTSEAKIIEAVKVELAKLAVTVESNKSEAEDIACLVADELKESGLVAEYKDEVQRVKAMMIKDALAGLKEKIPTHVTFGDFQKLVEAQI